LSAKLITGKYHCFVHTSEVKKSYKNNDENRSVEKKALYTRTTPNQCAFKSHCTTRQ